MSRENDSIRKTIIVAVTLCLVCSVLVSAAAVFLKPAQIANATLDRKRNILVAAGLYEPGVAIEKQFERIETRVVDLQDGDFDDDVDPNAYDQRSAAKDPNTSVQVPPQQDVARIRRRAKSATVYLVRDAAGAVESIILPVHGYGLWSTMYGFLALAADARTVVGFKFYEQGETAGLGGEVDNPRWLALWPGKQVFDDEGDVALKVIKGTVDTASEQAKYQIDGLSGATLTANGVTNLLTYWLGDNGFGPFLAKFRSGENRG